MISGGDNLISMREFIEFLKLSVFLDSRVRLITISIIVIILLFYFSQASQVYRILFPITKLFVYIFLLRLFYLNYGLDIKMDAINLFTIVLCSFEIISGIFETINILKDTFK